MTKTVHQLKVTLRQVKPPVWRRASEGRDEDALGLRLRRRVGARRPCRGDQRAPAWRRVPGLPRRSAGLSTRGLRRPLELLRSIGGADEPGSSRARGTARLDATRFRPGPVRHGGDERSDAFSAAPRGLVLGGIGQPSFRSDAGRERGRGWDVSAVGERDDGADDTASMVCESAGSISAKLPLEVLRNRP